MLSAYLPIDRRLALSRGERVPEEDRGTVMLADISGFTKLTECLFAQFGERRGPEELLSRLNRVYDALIDRVHEYGGSVVSFSGDSITCWFSGDDGRRGVRAGLAMQSAMDRLREEGIGISDVTIGLKVALANGTVRRWEVGDPEIQRVEALAGEVVYEVARVEAAAELGDVLVSPDIRNALSSDLRLSGHRESPATSETFVRVSGLGVEVAAAPWNDGVELPEADLRPRFLAPVYQRLKHGQGEFIAELRPATPVFIQFSGIDYENDPNAPAALDDWVARVQSVLERYEGALLSLTIGEKGSYLYANFGALLAHPDDPIRAVHAALEIVDDGRELDAIDNVRIGISWGRVRAGAYGGRYRRTYGALGDDVNLAARLMQSSESWQITVSERVRDAAAEAAGFSSRGEVRLKGKSAPVSIYEVTGRRVSQAPIGTAVASRTDHVRRVIVGRTRERAALVEAADRVTEGGSRVVVIDGEAGIGKSHLLADARERLVERGFRVLGAGGDAIERRRPYHAVRQVFRTLFELDGTETSDLSDVVLARLPDDPEVIKRAPLLAPVLPFSWPDNDFTARLEGEVRASNTQQLFLRILEAETRARPLALIFEDGHWFDSASWQLIRRLPAEVTPLLLVLTTRPPEGEASVVLTEDALSRLVDGSEAVRLSLGPLERGDIAGLLSGRLGVDRIADELTDHIAEQAGGQPFFCEELALSLSEDGLLVIEEGAARLAEGAAEKLRESRPDSVQAVITSRLDRLEPGAQTALKAASVLGRSFDLDAMRAVLPEDVALESELATLGTLDFIRAVGADRWLFKHALIQDSVYDVMLFAQRRQLHGQVAEWIEERRGADVSPKYALLAHHWERAEDAARAVHYLDLAGKRALHDFANPEAIGFFERALRLDESGDRARRAGWMRCLGDAHEFLGELPQSQKCSEDALHLLGMPQPASMPRLVPRLYGEIFFRMAQSQVRSLRQAKTDEGRERLLEAARAHLRLTQVYYYTDQAYPLVLSGLAQLNLASRVGDSRELAQAYAIMSAVASTVPMFGLAKSWADAALEVAERIGDPALIAFVLIRNNLMDVSLAHWDKGNADLGRAAELTEQIGDGRTFEMVRAVAGAMNGYAGDFHASERAWRESWESAQKRGDPQALGWGKLGVAIARYRTSTSDEPVELLKEALPAIVKAGSFTHQYQANGMLALADAEAGNDEGALAHVKRANELLGYKRPSAFFICDGYAGTARALLLLLERHPKDRELRNLAKKSVALLGTFSTVFPFAAARAKVWAGLHQSLLGKEKKALKTWRAGLEDAERLSTPYEAGLLHLELGRHGSGPERERHLSSAIRTLEAVGARRDLARAHAV